jgi:hypothetical protein
MFELEILVIKLIVSEMQDDARCVIAPSELQGAQVLYDTFGSSPSDRTVNFRVEKEHCMLGSHSFRLQGNAHKIPAFENLLNRFMGMLKQSMA